MINIEIYCTFFKIIAQFNNIRPFYELRLRLSFQYFSITTPEITNKTVVSFASKIIYFCTIQMNPNIPYSQSLKKFVYKSNPLQLQVDRYLQRSFSYLKKTSDRHLPSLQIRPYSKQTSSSKPSKGKANSSKYNIPD